MRAIAWLLFFAVCAISVPSYGEVQLIKAKNARVASVTQEQTDNYQRNINQLDQMSDEISAQLFSGKKSADRKQDGMQITLVSKARR
ncbi:MAG: hypothetical protein AB7N80_00210 [Bdellovibrionales bacterium]